MTQWPDLIARKVVKREPEFLAPISDPISHRGLAGEPASRTAKGRASSDLLLRRLLTGRTGVHAVDIGPPMLVLVVNAVARCRHDADAVSVVGIAPNVARLAGIVGCADPVTGFLGVLRNNLCFGSLR